MAKCKQCGLEVESDFINLADVSFNLKVSIDKVGITQRWGILDWDDKSIFCGAACFGEYVKDNVEKIVKQVKGEDEMAKKNSGLVKVQAGVYRRDKRMIKKPKK